MRRPDPRFEFSFSLNPITQVMARLRDTFQIDFVCSNSDFLRLLQLALFLQALRFLGSKLGAGGSRFARAGSGTLGTFSVSRSIRFGTCVRYRVAVTLPQNHCTSPYSRNSGSQYSQKTCLATSTTLMFATRISADSGLSKRNVFENAHALERLHYDRGGAFRIDYKNRV